MNLLVWWLWCGAVLGAAHAHCSVKRSDPRACLLDVACFGELSAPRVPSSCATPRFRLHVRAAPAPPEPGHCPLWTRDTLALKAIARWTDPPSQLLACLPNLHVLQLSGNRFNSFPTEELRNLTEMRSLDLAWNNIQAIPVDAFSTTKRLQRIFLSHNMIANLEPGTFSNLTLLEHLDLSHNSLMVLDRNTFRGLVRLNVLKLNDNQIFLLGGALKHLHALEHLYLRSNKLHNLDLTELPDRHELRTLDITNNTLSAINPEVLARFSVTKAKEFARQRAVAGVRLEPVAKILLAKNKIITLENSTFVNPASLHNNRPIRHNKVEIDNSEAIQSLLHSGNRVATEIDLSYNMIEKVEFDAFTGIWKLVYLDLSFNRLANFTVNTTNLQHLGRLILRNNHLLEIDHKTLYSLTKLTRVDISGNNISTFPEESEQSGVDVTTVSSADAGERRLGDLENLQHLDVSRNDLSRVSLTARQFGGLRRLLLASNRIPDLSAVRLQFLLELNELDLSHNEITNVTAHALAHVPALKKLDLARNRITSVNPDAFLALPRLASLDLSDNNLTELRYGTFAGLAHLEELKLSQNRIAQLDSRVLFDLQSLVRLDLEANALSQLDVSMWRGRRTQISVLVGGNRLSCSWLATALEEARQGKLAVWLVARRSEGDFLAASSVGGISCEPAVPVSRFPIVAYDDKLLDTNKKILDAVLNMTTDMKKMLGAIYVTLKANEITSSVTEDDEFI